MKIFKIEIKNYRLLKNFSMDLEEPLSLVIGKNNTGKTSILSVLDKFLDSSERAKFAFDDFNIDFNKELKKKIAAETPLLENNYKRSGIYLRLFIQYSEEDNLSNISQVMMDLDPDKNIIVLSFEYNLDFNGYTELRKNFKEFQSKENNKSKKRNDYQPQTLSNFLKTNFTKYFRAGKYSMSYDPETEKANEDDNINLDTEKISITDIINFKYISAKRDVTNKDSDKALSSQTSKIYKRSEVNEEKTRAVENFKHKLIETDTHLSSIYNNLFDDVVKKVKEFGGVDINESEIEIVSTLQHRELLEGNTKVMYKHDKDNYLPEHYNGLGYMNLISMIFEIEILIQEFKRAQDKKPADINLLFIEEPEAHTHPQMQYIFIKNIKKLLGEGIKRQDGENRSLQYVISTHSAHIVADSDFDTIKYLRKCNQHGITSRNLKTLKREYENETKQYQFLKQYLTISRAEIFFADKAILIEGDTERILIPSIMRKMDIEKSRSDNRNNPLPLLSQNISVVEVGSYSQIFEKFIEFLGIKCLVITDIDSTSSNNEACSVHDGEKTCNSTLNHYFKNVAWNDLKKLPLDKRTVSIKDAQLLVCYQQEENDYHARSFEDAFIHINKQYITEKQNIFKSLKNQQDFNESNKNAYELAKNCVKKKTHFALDIIYNSNEDFSNWNIPMYIKEGLSWLQKD